MQEQAKNDRNISFLHKLIHFRALFCIFSRDNPKIIVKIYKKYERINFLLAKSGFQCYSFLCNKQPFPAILSYLKGELK